MHLKIIDLINGISFLPQDQDISGHRLMFSKTATVKCFML